MFHFIKNILEIFGIVCLRFRPLPRTWCFWLIAVNVACLWFIDRIEAQVVLAVTLLAIALQAVIYQRTGFTRILGIVHVAWLPMFVWMATRLESIAADPGLQAWLALLFATNLVSLVIDTADMVRFVRGERAPYYHWSIRTLAA